MKTKLLLVLLSSIAFGCGGAVKQADDAKTASDESSDEEGSSKSSDKSEKSESHGSSDTDDKSGDKAEGAQGESAAPKKDECTGFEIANLEDILLKSACEVPNPKPDEKPADPKNIEVKLIAPSRITPGGHVGLIVSFTNKSKEPLPLFFMIDPMPRFEVQAFSAKTNNRADMPNSQPPPLPAGIAPRVPGDPHTARIVLAPNGSAKMTLGWDASRTKWAPEKLKGTPPERGYPRVPAGPLPKGKYILKVVTPLIGFFEGFDKEVSQPKAQIEVAK